MHAYPAFAASAGVSPASTFAPCRAVTPRAARTHFAAPPCRRVAPSMVSQTNIAKKASKVASVVEKLESSQMVFAAALDGLTVKDVAELKGRMPPTTTIATVKNTLMRRAIAETKWEEIGEFVRDSNMWFFVGEDIKQTVESYQGFVEELKREDLKGGVFEGVKYDCAGITAIAALPTKIELITKIAVSLKMIPTKLGRSVKAIPSKLARSIKLAVADDSDGAAPAAE